MGKLRKILNKKHVRHITLYILKLLRKINIQTRLISSFFLLTFIPLAVTSYMTYKHSSEDIEGKIKSYSVQAISETTRNLNTELKHIESLCEELMMANEIQKELSLYNMTSDLFEKYQIEDNIVMKFTEKMRVLSFNISSNLTSIDIMTDEDTVIGAGQNNYYPEQFKEIYNSQSREASGYHYKVMVDCNGDFEIVLFTQVSNHITGQNIGLLILTFKEKNISDICKNLYIGEDAEVFILDSYGTIVSSGNVDRIPKGEEYSDNTLIEKIKNADLNQVNSFSMSIKGEKRLVVYDCMDEQEWHVVGTIPYHYIQAESARLMKNIIILGLVCLVVSISLAIVISNSISVPLTRLKKLMNDAKIGRLDVAIIDDNSDEIGEMGEAFNEMMASIRSLVQENIETQKEIVYKLGEAIELRSRETGNHIKRVSYYSRLLAIKYGFSEEKADMIKMASTLHDIGKISIADDILLKPGKLTPDEYDKMKEHTRIGFHILSNSNKPLLKIASIIALEHHERHDGAGYPNGLIDEQINIYSKIVTLTDVFDALGTERVYKKKWEFDEIIEYIKEQRGKQFDPIIVDLFLDNLEEISQIQMELSD